MMQDQSNILQQYHHAFTKLRCAPTRYGLAPHKPVFLLSLIEQVEKGYVFLGLANFVKYQGAKPMNIEWKLEEPMPAYIYQESAKLAVG